MSDMVNNERARLGRPFDLPVLRRLASIAAAAAVGFVLSLSLFAPGAAHAAEVAGLTAPEIPSGYTGVPIRSFSDLITQVLLSRSDSMAGKYLYLDLAEWDGPVGSRDGVIDLTGAEVDSIISQIGSLTFGSSDHPFKGIFDGCGYTIKGLNYQRDLWVPKPDTGLFAWTDGAIIKNINFEDAYVGADYRGGVIVGYGYDTRIEHVKLVNCVSSVTPANNAVSLITNAGLAGGMVGGELDGCKLYDVEVQGGRVINNSTVAVSGLGGEGLYLGAIAGIAKNSTIEYSRVTPIRTVGADGAVEYAYTEVANKYDVAVGALAGQALYAGGIVGGLYSEGDGQVAAMIDCFSTAECHTYAATYVSVGAGNVGYVGGLAGRTDNTVYLARCHYAGNLHSELYNAILVIPIIQRNVYLGGLIEWDNDGLAAISDCFFNRKRSNTPGTNKDIPAIGIDKRYAGPSFGEQSDATYIDRPFWEEHGYDFEGGIARKTLALGGKEHVNKWVMDFDLGMPVHGDSVKATLDYPGAGKVTIGASDVLATQTPQSTTSPYDFAVQGFVVNDLDMTFTAETNPVDESTAPLVSDMSNQGYAFRGWYREPKVTVNHIDASHAFFDPIIHKTDGSGAAVPPVSRDLAYTARNTGPGTSEGFAGDDLFVAYYQGQVLFHDVKGGVIELDGTASTGTDDDWYDHEAPLPACTESKADRAPGGPVSADARFMGWTTRRNTDTSGYAGWPSVSADVYKDMQTKGELYAAGDAIMQPMDLYPVYADSKANIVPLVEGYGYDVNGDPVVNESKNIRRGVAEAHVEDTPGGAYQLTLTPQPADGKLPDGYRFLGWYETDATGTKDIARVSDELTYVIPETVDLTERHYYIARFEYRVDYLIRFNGNGGNGSHRPYMKADDRFERFESPFYNANASEFIVFDEMMFDHWSKQPECDVDCTDLGATPPTILAPLVAYGHTRDDGYNYDILADCDFPGGGVVTTFGNPALSLMASFGAQIEPYSSYTFWYWSGVSSHGWSELNGGARWQVGGATAHDPGASYEYIAHVTADVTFHGVDEASNTTVQRRKDAPYLLDADNPLNDDYSYGLGKGPIPSADIDKVLGVRAGEFVEKASPSAKDMARPGYCFLGWIDGTTGAGLETEKGGAVWNRIFDVAGEAYCTSDIALAEPYLVDESDVTKRASDLYPVYAKYDYSATTNIARAGVPAGSGVNVPADPVLDPAASAAAGAHPLPVTMTADTGTQISTDNTGIYQLVSWTVERDGAVLETIATVGGQPVSNANAKLTYDVLPGHAYTFVANYEPVAVVYHITEDATHTVVRNKGDKLGNAPAGQPSFAWGTVDGGDAAEKRAFYIGWTTQRPEGNAVFVEQPSGGKVPLVSPSMNVDRALEIFPVFEKATLKVNSYADGAFGAGGAGICGIEREVEKLENGAQSTCNADASLVLRAYPRAGYRFDGWYKNFDPSAPGSGEKLTTGWRYVPTTAELRSTDTYTAVYTKVHEVRYHDTEGGVIYTATVDPSSSRTFVIRDENGKITGLEDVEAWRAMAKSFAEQSAAPGATERYLLKSWNAYDDKGNFMTWDQFWQNPISGDMDLYPAAYRVSAFDSEAAGENITAELGWSIDQSDAAAPVKVCFMKPYTGTVLRVNVADVNWKRGGATEGTPPTKEATPVVGTNVALYVSTASTAAAQTKLTNTQGDAIFKFDASHALTITKRTSDPGAAGKTFSFAVTDMGTGLIQRVNVTLPQGADADGYYTASVKMTVPMGHYRVAEDSAWAWRYEAHVADPSGKPAAKPPIAGPETYVDLDVVAGGSVTCENVLMKGSWIDDDYLAHNVFAPQGEGQVTAHE